MEDTVVEELGTEHETTATGHDFDVQRAALHFGGQPHLRARNQAIAALFDTPPPILSEKVTVLTLLDSGGVTAIEGRYRGGERPALLRKGAQRSGYYLDRINVIEHTSGYRAQLIGAAWEARKMLVPELEKVNLDGIPERDEDEDGIAENTELIQAVFIGTHPGFGTGGEGRTAGCMWLITDKQTDEDDSDHTILNGYFWCPEGAELTSEHGSIYASHLERWAGRVKDFTPGGLTFRQCVMDEIPTGRVEAYQWVMASAKVPA